VDGNLGVANVLEGVLIEQPTTDAERAEVAEFCTTSLEVTLPTILDKIDDRVANAYAAFPDRIYIVGADGRIAYKGLPGPAGFNVPEALAALEVAMVGGITPYGAEPGQDRFGRGGRGGRGGRAGRGAGVRFQGAQGVGQGMGVMDQDQDGQISADEWQGESEAFEGFDVNADGYLTFDEIQRVGFGGRGRGGNPQMQFENLDANSDGRISPEEFPGPAPMFSILDADGDGALIAEEMTAGLGRGRGAQGGDPASRFATMDADGDGLVSRDEWGGPEETFPMLDSNGDGGVSSDEMLAGRGARGVRGGRGARGGQQP
jgi:hypothetical protein